MSELSGLSSSSTNELFSASVANERGQSLAPSICFSHRSSTSSHCTRTSKFSGSTTISIKRLKAEERLRIAQLEASQLQERVKEKALLEQKRAELDAFFQQNEARRKVELAMKRCEIWSESSLCGSAHKGHLNYLVKPSSASAPPSQSGFADYASISKLLS